MDYAEWERTVPTPLLEDPLWRMKAYRLALFLADLVQRDASALRAAPSMHAVVAQLTLAVASIGANIAEGYGRSTGRDRARFFEYALGSARESRHFYYAARFSLPSSVMSDRLALLEETIRLLVAMVRYQRPDSRAARIP